MLKKSFKLFLCYLLVLPTHVLADTAVLSFNDFNQPRISTQSTAGLYFSNGMVNEYRLLGFSNYPTLQLNALNQAISTQTVVLRSNFNITGPAFTDPVQRADIFRQYRGAFSALQVQGHTTFDHLMSRYEHHRPIVERQFPQDQFRNVDLRNERVQLEINKRIINEFSSEQRQSAYNRIESTAKNAIRTPNARATLNIRAGLSTGGALPRVTMNYSPSAIYNHARGRVTIPVQDQFGRRTNVVFPQDPRVIANERASDIVKQSKLGTFASLSLMGVAIGSFLFFSSMIKSQRDFENNPRAFERTQEQMLGAAMPLSIFSFFIGGAASQAALGGDLNAYRRSLAHMDHLIKQERAGHISSAMRRRVTESYMRTQNPRSILARATSHRGLAGGLIISKLVYLSVDKLQSCLRLSNYYGTTDDNYPAYRVTQLEQSCNRAWNQVWSQVMSNPQTYMELIALLSTKTIMTLGMSGAQALTYGVFKDQAERQAAQQASRTTRLNSMKVVARGVLRSPVVRVVAGFTAFALIFHTILWGLGEAYAHLTVSMPASNVRKGLAELFEDLKDSGWNMESLCRSYDYQGSFLGRTWRSIWDWDKEQTCGVQLAQEYIDHHNGIQDDWRAGLMNPFQEATVQWQEYSHKMLNGYNATYLFYKDISEQVRVKRLQGNAPDFGLSPSDQWVYYNDPLPLFRSDPFFGLDYRLTDEESDAISYPIWNGRGADWEARSQNSQGVDSFNDRIARFQSEVIPALAGTINESLSFADQSQRGSASDIITKLTSGNTDQVVLGLQSLSDLVDSEPAHCTTTPSNQYCDGLFNCTLDLNSSYRDCFFHLVQRDYLDNDVWSDDENGLSFRPKNYGAYGRINPTFTSYEYQPHHGVMPLGIGQRFFIDYSKKLDNNQIDTGFFPDDHVSLTDFLSRTLICGPSDPESNWNLFGSLSSPDFIPIRPDYTTNVARFCQNTTYIMSSPEPGDEWRGKSGFYDDLRVDSGETSYNTLSALLYNHLSDEFVNDFDGWWRRKVTPQFTQNFERLYQEYYVENLVEGDLGDIIYGSTYESTCATETAFCGEYSEENKSALKSTIVQELDLYFSNVFDEVVKTFPMDLRYTPYTEATESDARAALANDYNKRRSQIYSLVRSIFSTVNVSLLDEEVQAIYNTYMEEVQAHKEASGVEHSSVRDQLDTLNFVLSERMFNLRIMFKAESSEGVGAYREAAAAVINNLDLEEEERAVLLQILDAEVNDLRTALNNKPVLRANRVIVEYHDWPDDLNLSSPTLEGVTSRSLDRIEEIVEYYIEMNKMRDLLVTSGEN